MVNTKDKVVPINLWYKLIGTIIFHGVSVSTLMVAFWGTGGSLVRSVHARGNACKRGKGALLV